MSLGLWMLRAAQSPERYEKHRVVDNMNDCRKWAWALNIMNNSRLWDEWLRVMSLGLEMLWKNSRLCMTLTTSGHELRPLDTMNIYSWHERLLIVSSMLYNLWITKTRELKRVNAMNHFRMWIIWMILFHELKPLDAMWFMPNWCLSWFVSSWCSLIEGVINKIYNL